MRFIDKNLKYLLKKTGKSQSYLSDLLNIGRTSISNWINGVASPDFETIEQIANIFDIVPADLIYKDLSATDMTINIRANKGSNPNVQILDTVKESIVGYQVHTGIHNDEKLREENLNLKARVSFLEGQIEVYRELLNKKK